VGTTGKMAMQDTTVYLYGNNSGLFVYKSNDNGTTWVDISSNFPANDLITFMYAMGSEMFAVVGSNQIYSSTNDWADWNFKSTVPYANGTNSSATINLTSDGNTLYAVTNRASVFKSNDNGLTWSEIYIDYSQGQLQGFDFAAMGSKMVFSAANLGTFYSTDAGANWSLKTSPLVGAVHPFAGEFYGSSTVGIYKIVADTGWVPFNNGLPINGIITSTKCAISNSTSIFTYFTDLFAGSKIFASYDNGNSWSETDTGLPTATTYGLNDFMAANDEYLYCYISPLFPENAKGVYRLKLQNVSGISGITSTIPNGFELKQNYPNPFNPSTIISYTIDKPGIVRLKVFDILGNEISTLVNEYQNKGNYKVDFNGKNLSSGTYFYRLNVNGRILTKKLLLIR